MNAVLVASVVLASHGFVEFRRHTIDDFRAGYGVAVADVNGNGKPDVIALSTEASRIDWFENPGWEQHSISRTERPVDAIPFDIDGDGRPELAVAAGFYFADGTRGGEIQLLEQSNDPKSLWQSHPIGVDPVVHRLRWGDLDGDGRRELVHAPIFGPGSRGPRDAKPAHLWAFRPPEDLRSGKWETWKIDETLGVLHGVHVSDLDGDGRDEILTASSEGIHRHDFEGQGEAGRWRRTRIAAGIEPSDSKPNAPGGASEVVPGKLGAGRPFIATIEPWHGNQVVVYTPADGGDTWRRRLLDDSLEEGHALVVADLDGDGQDEIVAGWRRGEGGLVVYDPLDSGGERWAKVMLDTGIKVENAVVTDINGDGLLDIVAIAGRSNTLVWYENLGRRRP